MERIVIVTGAAGMYGGAIASAFGEAGNQVIACDIKMPLLAKVVAQINKGPGQAFPYEADVRCLDQVETVVEETLRRWKRIDVIASVAGGDLLRVSKATERKLIIDSSDDDWDVVVDTNLKGAFHCIKAVAAPMIKQKEGHIILMGSGTGAAGGMREAAYAAAKAGLCGLMKSAALELGKYNVKVNVVCPGRALHSGETLDKKALKERTLKRLSDVSSVASFFVHLSRAPNVSGQIINWDSRIIF